MTPGRWRRIETLVDAALQLTPDQRPAFIAEACGPDDELRREVESLLAVESREAEWLEQPPGGVTVPLPAPLAPGTLLGAYRILEAIRGRRYGPGLPPPG